MKIKMSVDSAKVIAELWFKNDVFGTADASVYMLLQHTNDTYLNSLKYLVENGNETEEHLFNRLCYDFVWDEEDRLKELLNKAAYRQKAIRKDIELLRSLSNDALTILHDQAVATKEKRIDTLYEEHIALSFERTSWFGQLDTIQRQKKSAREVGALNDNSVIIVCCE